MVSMKDLVYTSTINADLGKSDILAILKAAREFNNQNNITGCLVMCKNQFIQLLEGNEVDLKAVFNRIEKDPRHSNIQIVAQNAIATRNFPEWAMIYHNFDDVQWINSELNEYIETLKLLSNTGVSSTGSLSVFWENVKNRMITKC
jgi:hypothetical protein